MLPPISAFSTASASLAPRDVPAVAQQVLATIAAMPDAAVALSLAANSEVEGKLNMLLLGARERMIDSLFAVIDAVSQSLAMQPEAGESNVGYALRLAAVVNDLASSQVASVQQQLNAQGQTAPLALVARALQNPAGSEAAQVVAYMEVVRYKEKDLATKAVVASYGQNGGDEEPEAANAPVATPPTLVRNNAESATPSQSKLPIAAGPAAQAVSASAAPPEEPAEAVSAQKPSVPAPLQQTSTPSPQAASSAQAGGASAKLPASPTPVLPQAAAPLPITEPPAAAAISAPQTVSAPLPVEPPEQAVAIPTPAMSMPKDERTPAVLNLPAQPAVTKLADLLKSVGGQPVAVAATAVSPPMPQAPAARPLATPPANAGVVPQPQPLPPTTTYPPATVAAQAFAEAAELLPAVASVIEDEIVSLIQPSLQTANPEEASVPLSPQPPQPLSGKPLLPVVNGQIPQDVQAVLKVVVDRLVSTTGVQLLQTMAEVEPVAERVVAQALVADMLDSAELGALPSPDDAALPSRNAQAAQSATMKMESPVEELTSLVALNRLLAEPALPTQAIVQQQPLQAPLPLAVPFAVGQYLPADDAFGEEEALPIDRVDAVDDEEHEEGDGKKRRDAQEDEAEDLPEFEDELLPAENEFEAERVSPEARDPGISRPLALPRPAPMEPLRATAFNLYQRMGGWD